MLFLNLLAPARIKSPCGYGASSEWPMSGERHFRGYNAAQLTLQETVLHAEESRLRFPTSALDLYHPVDTRPRR